MTQEQYSAVCPYLGLADDADSHATYATEAHRCYRLPNPTRIASPHQESYCLGANHVTCPVYLGEGVPQTQQPQKGAAPASVAGAAIATGAASAAADGEAPVRGPRPGQRTRPQGEQRPKRPAGSGTMTPRPRAGGISMPVATIGLFALAIVVVALAFAIQQLVDDDGGDDSLPGGPVATAAALNRTRTAQAGGEPTQATNQTPATQQPAGSRTPTTGTQTPGTGTRTPTTGTPGASGETYEVQAGDFCGTIAADLGVTLQELLDENDMTEADCNTLQIGQKLKIPK